MRLIDADELIALIDKHDTNEHPIAKAMRVMINGQQTIDAIPISWIKEQIDGWEKSQPNAWHIIAYRHLIEDWVAHLLRDEIKARHERN